MGDAQNKQLTIADSLRRMEPEFKMALPSHIPAERFTRNAITAVNGNPDLLKPDVDRRSLYAAVMKAAQDGLIVDGREAALVTFKGRVQYMPMVEGIMKLVRNSGDVSVISVHVVKENDSFDYELGDNERMIHKPALTGRGKTIGAYSIVTMKDGEKSREWMDVDQIEAIRKRSRASGNGPWVTDYDEMCRKTVFRRHAKRLPKSTDIDEILHHDDEAMGLDPIQETIAPVEAPNKTRTRASEKVAEKMQPVEEKQDDTVIDVEYSEADAVDDIPL